MAMKRIERGFTIVELLIVIVVIAILGVISLVAYKGIADRANDTAIESDLTNLKKKIDLFIAVNNRRPTNPELPTVTPPISVSKQSYALRPTTDHNLIFCHGGSDPTAYTIVAYSKSGKKFFVSRDGAVQEYTTTWSDQVVACQDSLPTYSSNYRGYAAEDTSGGPWRSWVGGN